jgi:broad specificity phosphatase PhoE
VHEDWQGVAYGDLDVPLSSAGEARTEELAADLAELGPDLVLSSPLERARRLGEALAARSGAPLRITPDLREIHRGSWQGRSVGDLHARSQEDVRAFYADPWTWRGHGGESDELLAARVRRPLAEALDGAGGTAGAPGRIVVTTHYNVIRVLAACALGIPSARSFAFRVDPARVSLLVDEVDGWHLLGSNVHRPRPRAGARG